MRVILQRVKQASVVVDGTVTGAIDLGLLILVGIEDSDEMEDVIWLGSKILNMRIFSDEDGKMNHSLVDVGGAVLVVSQFTLHASTKKGNRPSFVKAARPEKAIPLYNAFCEFFESALGKSTQRGIFGAHMDVSLNNDGPVTIILDSKNKE